MQRKIIDISLERRNILENPIKDDVILGNSTASINYKPRQKDLIYDPPKRKKNKRIWSFPISIFKDWKKDDEVNSIL